MSMTQPSTRARRSGIGAAGAAGIVLAALVLAAGCAPATRPVATPTPAETAPPAASPPALPLAIQWVRSSAEHRAAYLEVYHAATVRLDSLASGHASGSWAVILDADETVLDNSQYEARRAALGLGYTEKSWDGWVRQEAAPALPGARSFVRAVHALGGKVVIVTNRTEALCPSTRANLLKDEIETDLVLCRPPNTGDKNPRFRAVQDGTASPALPPLHVLMWLGDNIQDFPHLSQAMAQQPDSAFQKFGRSYFLLPNPMYGSWQRIP